MDKFNMPTQIVTMPFTSTNNFGVTTPIVLTYDNHFKNIETFNFIQKLKYITPRNEILAQPMTKKQRRVGN